MRKFNLSLDDFSPHPKSGLGFESIQWCDKLIEDYSDLKINLFVPTRYARLGETPNLIANNKEWVNKLKSLSKKNYRICLHGLYHRRSRKDFSSHRGIESNNNEWENLKYNEASILLTQIEEDFRAVGVDYSKVFRPPGWHIGKEAAQLLTDRGYLIAGDKRYFNKLKKTVSGLKWISYTWDMSDSYSGKENVLAVGHTSNWCGNYTDDVRRNFIINALETEEFVFRFLENFDA
jgi:predicted deacetylase